MVKKEEYSNLVALLTLQAKICGIAKENSSVNANIIGDEAIKGIVERANVKRIDPIQAQSEVITPVKQDTFKVDITQPIDNTTLTDKS
jgi:hypothetical protein